MPKVKINDAVWFANQNCRVVQVLPSGSAVALFNLGFPFGKTKVTVANLTFIPIEITGRFERRWWGWKFIPNKEA